MKYGYKFYKNSDLLIWKKDKSFLVFKATRGLKNIFKVSGDNPMTKKAVHDVFCIIYDDTITILDT